IEKRVNRGMTEFRIRGMRELSLRGDFVAQRAFATESEAVLGGLSIDEKSRAARICGGRLCSGAISFLADNKQDAKIPRPGSEQFLCCRDHGSHDAFCIAGSAAPDEFVVLT